MSQSLTLDTTKSRTIPADKLIEEQTLEPIKDLVRLIFIGVVTQIIYVTYIVAFPLISNTQAGGPAADLELLMRDYRWFAPIYTAGILLLYYLFWQAMQIVSNIKYHPSRENDRSPTTNYHAPHTPVPATSAAHGLSEAEGIRHTPHFALRLSRFMLTPISTLKILVVVFGLLFGFTLVWLYPITAIDLFRYVVIGRVWTIHGESPLITPPHEFPDDPYLPFAGEFEELNSVYGPVWEIVVQVPLRLGATNMVAGAISLKFVVLLAYLICAILIGWIATPEKGSSLAALTFFAWNPLILMQGPGNGHNDMVFMVLMVFGIILWQRRVWWAAAFVLTLAVLAKVAALLIIPLFGVVLLRSESTWQQRILKGSGAILIGTVTASALYLMFGPISETLSGVLNELTNRRGFAIASGVRMILREIIPRQVAEPIPRATGRYIFILFYGWILLRLWRNKLDLVTAGFLAYFSQLMLGRTFRIWYPTWLIPLAALHLTPAIFWRTFLFGLTAELSIINYFVVWRWWLRDLPWGKAGLLSQYWNYWTIMHSLTVPWVFGIPLFGPIIIKWNRKKSPQNNNTRSSVKSSL